MITRKVNGKNWVHHHFQKYVSLAKNVLLGKIITKNVKKTIFGAATRPMDLKLLNITGADLITKEFWKNVQYYRYY